jgi:hypothetical protein
MLRYNIIKMFCFLEANVSVRNTGKSNQYWNISKIDFYLYHEIQEISYSYGTQTFTAAITTA